MDEAGLRITDGSGQCVQVDDERIARIILLILVQAREIQAAQKGRVEINFAGSSLSAQLIKSLPVPN